MQECKDRRKKTQTHTQTHIYIPAQDLMVWIFRSKTTMLIKCVISPANLKIFILPGTPHFSKIQTKRDLVFYSWCPSRSPFFFFFFFFCYHYHRPFPVSARLEFLCCQKCRAPNQLPKLIQFVPCLSVWLSLSLSSASDRFPQHWKRLKLQTLKSFKKQFGQNRGEEGTGRVLRIVFVP